MMVATRLAEASATLRAQSEPLRLSRTGHWDERVAPLCALLCLVKVPPLSCSRHLAEQGEERRRDKMRREEKLKDFPAPRCPRSRHNSPPPPRHLVPPTRTTQIIKVQEKLPRFLRAEAWSFILSLYCLWAKHDANETLAFARKRGRTPVNALARVQGTLPCPPPRGNPSPRGLQHC